MIPTITFVILTINIKGKYETAVIHQDKAKGKTCMRRRDKTFLRAPVPAGLMHARQWVTGLHLAGQTTGDGGGWVGGGVEWRAAPKRGHRGFYACSLFISCAITLKSPARCSAQELHAVLQKRWTVVVH